MGEAELDDAGPAVWMLAGIGFDSARIGSTLGMSVEQVETVLARAQEPEEDLPEQWWPEPEVGEPEADPEPPEPLTLEEQQLKAAMSAAADVWPPEPSDTDRWEVVRSRGGDVRVRWVRLWGQRVRIDTAGLVFCHACARFLTPAELSRPAHGHPVGPPSQGVSEVFAVPLERAPVQYGFGVW